MTSTGRLRSISAATSTMAASLVRCGTRTHTRMGKVAGSTSRDSHTARIRRAILRGPPSPANSNTGPGVSTSNCPSQGVVLATETAISVIPHVFPALNSAANMP